MSGVSYQVTHCLLFLYKMVGIFGGESVINGVNIDLFILLS